MNKRNAFILVLVVIAIIAFGGIFWWMQYQTQPSQDQSGAVRDVVTQFGSQLKNVSLLVPDAANQIKTQYQNYVTGNLLAQWMADPSHAPGRLTSSPWPDRIEITAISSAGTGSYTVTGNIIEITSSEVLSGGAANLIPVTMTVSNDNNQWKISAFQETQNRITKDDLIWVSAPLPNQTVSSPLVVTGQARGSWYFEASFPVKLYDANGNLVAQAAAQAQGDWMTQDYVPFTVTLTFTHPATTMGTLVLEKDNPSGLPQNANQLEIPVKF